MLNGIDPIIIFQFSQLTPDALKTLTLNPTLKIPIISSMTQKVDLPPIPIYLKESLTGLYIDSESKTIDIETSTDTVAAGLPLKRTQKGINSTVKIEMVGSSDSIGLTLVNALADLIIDKVTAQTYSISYFHGGIFVFNGLLHSYACTQQANNTLFNISMELSYSTVRADKGQVPEVKNSVTGITPLSAH